MSRHIDKDVFKRLTQREMRPWLLDMIKDWAFIIFAFLLADHFHHLLGYIFAAFVIGNRQHALAILAHDGAHRLICYNRKLNDFLTGVFTFWPLWVPLQGYRDFHFAHHKHVGTEKDPELKIKRKEKPQWDLPFSRKKLIWNCVLDLMGRGAFNVFNLALAIRPRNFQDFLPVLLWHGTAIGLLGLNGLLWVYALWQISIFTTFWMFFRLRGWLEHQGTGDTHRVNVRWWQKILFAPHNSWTHWEHHEYASIPYHNLGELRKLVKDVPVTDIYDLFESYAHAPVTSSGAALRK